jgi:cell division protein FtsZ
MVFITAGFGGGTGTGAAPVIGEICKDLGILTVAVVIQTLFLRGKKRMRQAEEGLESLKAVADTVITIPNDRLRGWPPKTPPWWKCSRRPMRSCCIRSRASPT